MTETLGDPRPSNTCPDCQRTSWHPGDVQNGYCGWCHWWTSDPTLAPHKPPQDGSGPRGDRCV
ncbi:hypothetical protein AB0M39_40195 [Streptomyces sp. NPDC051907]|uniref:hypothetical protein n=1 Tax=Streptomyces sp. NPDC051907 TaxID=3155284 RepID=UPI003439DCD2